MPTDDIARLRERAESGELTAQYEFGVRLLHGVGVPEDYAEAERWFRLAAARDVPGAQFCLGYMHDEGKGLPRDSAGCRVRLRRAGRGEQCGARRSKWPRGLSLEWLP